MIYPEGTINKNADDLLPLRFGGMKECIEADARIMLFIAFGDDKAWPKTSAAGGFPAKLLQDSYAFCPDGTTAYLKALREGGDLSGEEKAKEDHYLLAKYMRMEMQKIYDDLKAQANGGGLGVE